MLLIDIYLCTTAEEARCVLNLENSIQNLYLHTNAFTSQYSYLSYLIYIYIYTFLIYYKIPLPSVHPLFLQLL